MKKILSPILPISIFIGGAGLMLILYPHLFPPPVLDESVRNSDIQEFIAYGTFRKNKTWDSFLYRTKGDFKIYLGVNGNYILELQKNFKSYKGTNCFIYLNDRANIQDKQDFLDDTKRIKLTKLKSFAGSQIYEISPTQYDLADPFQSISILCEIFGGYIGNANLKKG